jgi:pSer/pThr/pTyr-binding forkhead associated (FHA) protein
MPEEKKSLEKKTSLDWLMRGVLTKIGDTFDRLTGRRYTPSSSLATSELIEKLKKLLDLEVRDLGAKGKFVPHNIKLKMQWDKFSTDADSALVKLENELKIAAIDHLNDNLYHTYAPLMLEVTPDYFTEGVKLMVSFDKFDEEKREASVNVTVPQIKIGDYLPSLPEVKIEDETETFIARFTISGKPKEVNLTFKSKQRRSVGRSKENDLSIEDASVSKIHAALVTNTDKQLMVADTGSTNGTFINDKRIIYGQAFPITNNDRVKFGNIEVSFEYVQPAIENEDSTDYSTNETISASQSKIQTVAFNSNENVSLNNEILPLQIPATKIVELKPVSDKVETETGDTDTNDRINYEFSNEE